jgi:hypothetical protein
MATTTYPLSRLALVAVSAVLMAPHGSPAQTPLQPVPLHKGCTGPIPPDYLVCMGRPSAKRMATAQKGFCNRAPPWPMDPPAFSLTSNSKLQANAPGGCVQLRRRVHQAGSSRGTSSSESSMPRRETRVRSPTNRVAHSDPRKTLPKPSAPAGLSGLI